MSQHSRGLRPSLVAAAAMLALSAQASSLVGFASMQADTFSHGPTSGQFVSSANGVTLPLVDKQPVQGFSAVLFGKQPGTFDVMPDNGFGNKASSPDALLRMYTLRPEFRTWNGSERVGAGSVVPVQRKTGVAQPSFDRESTITLHDPDHLLGFARVADGATYPYAGSGPGSAGIPVDKSIRKRSLLTGGDLDIESVRRDKNGHLWFGDEFGPFLVKTDNQGKVLRAEVPMAGVMSPSNPYLNGATPTLNNSSGFEGMAINPAGDTLYTLLEGTVVGDAAKSLRINAFSVDSEAYTGQQWLYKLDTNGTNIGDMTAVNDHQFLVIERNGYCEGSACFKKIFLIDLSVVDAEGYVGKTEVADLMNLADPHDLNLDGKDIFTFPFVTIEDVLVLDANTILVMNDNNYPGSSRDAGVPDPNEFLMIKLDQP
ncbi:MAG TPA: esterase-like activity of phytase family protein, partial [Ideonella sp.]|nr:esterase-like activity of phytase family protein [Ideonella sp.]